MSDDIEALIRATIQTKVIEAFNSAPDAIEKMVRAAFERPVDQYGGKPDEYRSRDKSMPWIEWLVGNELRAACTAVVREYIAERQDAIRAQIVAGIEKGNFADSIGRAIADTISHDYNWSVELKHEKRET